MYELTLQRKGVLLQQHVTVLPDFLWDVKIIKANGVSDK